MRYRFCTNYEHRRLLEREGGLDGVNNYELMQRNPYFAPNPPITDVFGRCLTCGKQLRTNTVCDHQNVIIWTLNTCDTNVQFPDWMKQTKEDNDHE